MIHCVKKGNWGLLKRHLNPGTFVAESVCWSDDINLERINLGDEMPTQALTTKMAKGQCVVKGSSDMSSFLPIYCSHTSLLCKNKRQFGLYQSQASLT